MIRYLASFEPLFFILALVFTTNTMQVFAQHQKFDCTEFGQAIYILAVSSFGHSTFMWKQGSVWSRSTYADTRFGREISLIADPCSMPFTFIPHNKTSQTSTCFEYDGETYCIGDLILDCSGVLTNFSVVEACPFDASPAGQAFYFSAHDRNTNTSADYMFFETEDEAVQAGFLNTTVGADAVGVYFDKLKQFSCPSIEEQEQGAGEAEEAEEVVEDDTPEEGISQRDGNPENERSQGRSNREIPDSSSFFMLLFLLLYLPIAY